MAMSNRDDKYLRAARRIFTHIAEVTDLHFCIRLWDDYIIPMGDDANPEIYISISSPGVLGAVLRRPTLENVLVQYATGGIDYRGCDLITFYETLRKRGKRSSDISSKQLKKKISKSYILRQALGLLTAPRDDGNQHDEFSGDETGRKQTRDDTSFIRFHYDISNDFYQLFLDPEAVMNPPVEREVEAAEVARVVVVRKVRLQ